MQNNAPKSNRNFRGLFRLHDWSTVFSKVVNGGTMPHLE